MAASTVSIDSSLSSGFILQVRIYIDPDRVAEFFTHSKPAYDLILAEPECVFFVLGQDTQEPGCITWTEGWSKDIDWMMNVQLKRDYYKPYLEATEPMYLKPRELHFITPQANMNHFKVPK